MNKKPYRTHALRPASLRLNTPRGGGSAVATGLSMALLMPLAAAAQTAPATEAKDVAQLPEVRVRAQAIDPNPNAQTGVPYKARTSGDPRHTKPLAETPQTIQVVTQKAIEESGATDLKAILAAQPGITLGTGENGNMFGDRYIIRGQELKSDVFVDGLRDPGMTIRESFAIEQVEITKGPNSSFGGRGTAGGAVNAITKQATLDYDFHRLSIGAGTDHFYRVTADVNQAMSDKLAVRANALVTEEDVPGRAPANRRRKGLALSALYEFNKDLDLTVDYYGLRAQDKPDLGSYLVGTVPNRWPASNVPVYAQDSDFINSVVDTGTARLRWRISPAMTLNSMTRYGNSHNAYITTGARGATASLDGTATNTYSTATLDSGHTGWQDMFYFAHQINLQVDTDIASTKNAFIFSAEYTDNRALKGAWTVANTGATNCKTVNNGAVSTTGSYCITNPDGSAVANLNNLTARTASRATWANDWHVRTLALSAMDTADLTDKLSVFGGVRADHFDFSLDVRANTGVVTPYTYSDTLWNGHLGVTYKVAPTGMIYASAGSAADINGGEPDAGTNSGYGGVVLYNGQAAGAAPEKSLNYEIGTKWDLFDKKLLATAAIFQTTKTGVMEGANYDTVGSFNSGKNRVHGIELGLVGNVTDKLTAQFGLAWMKSKVLASSATTTVNGQTVDIGQYYVGKPLSNFADKTASMQLKYQATDAFAFGGGARYESQRFGGQPDTACALTANTAASVCAQPIPSYSVFDLFASYRFNRHVEARLNLLNAGDRKYYTAAYRGGTFVYIGDARSLKVTVDIDF